MSHHMLLLLRMVSASKAYNKLLLSFKSHWQLESVCGSGEDCGLRVRDLSPVPAGSRVHVAD